MVRCSRCKQQAGESIYVNGRSLNTVSEELQSMSSSDFALLILQYGTKISGWCCCREGLTSKLCEDVALYYKDLLFDD